jgi:hypothetical protein
MNDLDLERLLSEPAPDEPEFLRPLELPELPTTRVRPRPGPAGRSLAPLVAGLLVVFACGGLLLTALRPNGASQAPGVATPTNAPSPTIDSADPRFARCLGGLAPVIAAFPMGAARDYHLHLPKALDAPELDDSSQPAFVVVFAGTWPGPVSRAAPPAGTTWPPRSPAPGVHDVCVWVGDAATGEINVYTDVDTTWLYAAATPFPTSSNGDITRDAAIAAARAFHSGGNNVIDARVGPVGDFATGQLQLDAARVWAVTFDGYTMVPSCPIASGVTDPNRCRPFLTTLTVFVDARTGAGLAASSTGQLGTTPSSTPGEISREAAIAAARTFDAEGVNVLDARLGRHGDFAPESGIAPPDRRVWAITFDGSFAQFCGGPRPAGSSSHPPCPPPATTMMVLVDAATGEGLEATVPAPAGILPSAPPSPPAGEISREAAIDAARSVRSNSLEVLDARVGALREFDPDQGWTSPDRRVWAVTFATSGPAPCEQPAPGPEVTNPPCPPLASTAMVIVDAQTGQYLEATEPAPADEAPQSTPAPAPTLTAPTATATASPPAVTVGPDRFATGGASLAVPVGWRATARHANQFGGFNPSGVISSWDFARGCPSAAGLANCAAPADVPVGVAFVYVGINGPMTGQTLQRLKPASGWTAYIDGMPAVRTSRTENIGRSADETRTWVVGVPGSIDTFVVAAYLRGPNLGALEAQVDAIAGSLRFDRPVRLPTGTAGTAAATAVVQATLDGLDRDARARSGSAMYGCFPRVPGASSQSTITSSTYGPLGGELDVTCSTSIEATETQVWALTLTVTWEAGPGHGAGTYTETDWIGSDGSTLAQLDGSFPSLAATPSASPAP